MKIWRNAGRFDAARSSPTTGVASIARNRAIDEIRHAGPGIIRAHDDLPDVASGVADPPASRARREDLARVMRCRDGLEGERRPAVLTAYRRGVGRPAPIIETSLRRSLARPGSGPARRGGGSLHG